MDLIAIPDFEAGAMENWGLVTYREIAMLANEKSSLSQKLYVCTVVAHELSHVRHKDHSKRFWAEVEKYVPDWKIHRKWLKDHAYLMQIF
jgi:predicted metal-dependent hydrolase